MWWKNTVIYELYVDKFANNFAGLTNNLDYLKNLGVTAIHVLPHYPSPMIDDGYDVSDYKNIWSELGTMNDFDLFVKKAETMGIKVILDLVLNHASTSHPLFLEASADRNTAAHDMFIWSDTDTKYPLARNVLPQIKPSNWIWNENVGRYYFSTFYPQQADFNWKNPLVMDYFLDIIDFWSRKGVDGFRIDAAPYLIKEEGTNCVGLPGVHDILMKIRKHLDKEFPQVILLAEVHDKLPKMMKYFDKDHECHLIYNFYLAEKMMLAFKRGDKKLFDKAVNDSLVIPQNSAWANFLRNHDEISLTGLTDSEINEITSHFDPENKFHFNNHIAMRLSNLFGGDKNKIITAHEWLFSVPGAHVLYYGDEIGMENLEIHADEDRRRVMRGHFNWSIANKEVRDPLSLYNAIRKIIAKRKLWTEKAPT